jgi:hypothetical protein
MLSPVHTANLFDRQDLTLLMRGLIERATLDGGICHLLQAP